MRAYTVPGLIQPIDQIQYVIDALAKSPHTRRALVSIWKPWEDAGIDDPACLQQLWFRVFDDELVLSITIRSNDAYKAAFMNMYVFTDVQRMVAEELSKRLGREIRVGQYTHYANSFHIYGSYFDEFKGFLSSVAKRPWDQRTYRSDDPTVQAIIEETQQKIRDGLAAEKAAGSSP